ARSRGGGVSLPRAHRRSAQRAAADRGARSARRLDVAAPRVGPRWAPFALGALRARARGRLAARRLPLRPATSRRVRRPPLRRHPPPPSPPPSNAHRDQPLAALSFLRA